MNTIQQLRPVMYSFANRFYKIDKIVPSTSTTVRKELDFLFEQDLSSQDFNDVFRSVGNSSQDDIFHDVVAKSASLCRNNTKTAISYTAKEPKTTTLDVLHATSVVVFLFSMLTKCSC